VHLLLVTANVPSSLILVTLMMEALHCSNMLVLTGATWHNIPEDGIVHSHHHENLKSYAIHICLTILRKLSGYIKMLKFGLTMEIKN
jgi:hypothetical protein